MKKDKLAKDFKLYNIIMTNFWKLITTVIIGVAIGYISTSKSDGENNYMVISVCVFLVIGIANFFIGIIKELKKLEKREKIKNNLLEKTEESDEKN